MDAGRRRRPRTPLGRFRGRQRQARGAAFALENPGQHFGDFEDRRVSYRRGAFTVGLVADRVEQLTHRIGQLRKAAHHHAHALFQHPIGVVALVDEGPGIPFHHHWQVHRQGFADRSRARLTDEVIGQRHEMRHLAGEAFHAHGDAAGQGAQGAGRFLVPSAEQDELSGKAGRVQHAGDFHHFH